VTPTLSKRGRGEGVVCSVLSAQCSVLSAHRSPPPPLRGITGAAREASRAPRSGPSKQRTAL
jgi:hypothetical protein